MENNINDNKDPIILIVDDNPMNLKFITEYIRGFGFQTPVATNGELAIKRANVIQPDLILLDIKMKGIDGIETCRRLKADEKTKDIPIIFMTALTDQDQKVEAFSAGGVDYITKPIQHEELIARVKTHLEIIKYRKELELEVQKRTAELKKRTDELENSNQLLEKEISERKRIQEQLTKREELLNFTLISMDDVVFTLDKDGNILEYYKTSQLNQANGQTEEINGKSFKDIFPLPVYKLINSAIKKLKETNQVQQIEYCISNNDENRWFSTKLSPRMDAAGKYQGVTFVARDITERKVIEEALQASEKTLSTLMNNLPGIVYRCQNDHEWTMEVLSEGCRRLTGYSPEDLLHNNKLSFNDIIYPDDRSNVYDIIQSAIEDGKTFELRYRIVTAKGEIRWLWERGQALYDDNKNIIALEGFITDVTELKEKEQQLMQAQKMETVGILAGGIAHDFNNILGGITGSIFIIKKKLLKEKLQDRDNLNIYIETIDEAANRATALVKQLLILSRKHELTLVPVDLNIAVKHIVKICESSFPKSIKIKTQYAENPLMIMADPIQIEQIILNLCVNAADAMTIMRDKNEKEGGTLSLFVGSIHADEYYCSLHPDAVKDKIYHVVKISDEGIGIPDEIKSRMFEPFYTTKQDNQGSGLGLSIVYNITKQHNGFIHVYSEIGSGTLFSIFFPKLIKKDTVAEYEPDNLVTEAGSGLILVVDDDKLMRTVARGILEDCGYSVILAENGPDCIEIFRQNHDDIEVVLLDMSMPELSGKDTFMKLKKIDPEVKVVLVSGLKREKSINELFELGVKGFIQKPYSAYLLSKKIKEVCNK